jgi:hypothetical protein
VAQGAGKRKGSRKAPKKKVQLDPSMLLHAAGITFCVIAWGYLVSAAIDFGSSARSGRSEAWLFLAVACIGAACCLFAGLMLGARLLRALGITSGPPELEQAGTLDGDLAGSTYTSSSHSSHGAHSSHGSHAAHSVNGSHGHAPQVPEPRPHGGGHRRAHR